MPSPYDALLQRMDDAGLKNGTPGFQIVKAARLLPPTPNTDDVIGDPPAAALRKLMKSYYAYGRARWTWAQSSPSSTSNGGLVKGAATACACGAFNWNFKWLAEKALGIQGMGVGEDKSQFITVPGGVCIDTKWKGNVSTAKQGVGQLKCFKFQGHYWATHGGVNYDVCFNNTFGSTAEIIWTKLLDPDPKLLAKTHRVKGELYKLAKSIPAGDHLVMTKKNGANAWPEWQIVAAKDVPPGK